VYGIMPHLVCCSTAAGWPRISIAECTWMDGMMAMNTDTGNTAAEPIKSNL